MSEFFIRSGRPVRQDAEDKAIPKVDPRSIRRPLMLGLLTLGSGLLLMLGLTGTFDRSDLHVKKRMLPAQVAMESIDSVGIPMPSVPHTISTPQGDAVQVDPDTGRIVAILDGRTQKAFDPWTGLEVPSTPKAKRIEPYLRHVEAR